MLFPDFIRAHFKKEAMASFISENVQHFGLGAAASLGADQQQCSVELFSGTRFQATLTVPATFFTAKTAEVLRHWHLNTGVNQINLQSRGSAPLGVDPDNSAQREELKRRTREYVNSLTFEPLYAEQVTDTDVRAAALQYVRKISGFRQPAAHNAEAFDNAVDAVARATEELLDSLEVRGARR